MKQQRRPKDWKNYDDFAAGIATNRLPQSAGLYGQSLALTLANGREIGLSFAAGPVGRSENGRTHLAPADLVMVAPDVFFLDTMPDPARPVAETLILSRASGRVLSVQARVRAETEADGAPRVAQDWQAGVIGGMMLNGPEPAPTRDLIERMAHYAYSPSYTYEHIYLSSERYAWQCLNGVQRGHGDVDDLAL